MKIQLQNCVLTNFKFYLRNRLFGILAVILAFIILLSMVPSLLFSSSSQKFDLVHAILESLMGIAYLLIASIAVIAISHHLRNRTVKMVITKWCPIEVWLSSHFVSGFVIALAFHFILLITGAALMGIWKIPFQWGLVFVLTDNLCRTMILFSYLVLLTVLFHPVAAILIALLFQENVFRSLIEWSTAGLRDQTDSWIRFLLHVVNWISSAGFKMVPSYSPFEEKTSGIYQTFRTATGDWGYLGISSAYAIILVFFCLLASSYVLKRRRLI